MQPYGKSDFDVFISHASEDKPSFVKPLADLLDEFGVRIWYDEFSLKVGDSLSRSIDRGMTNSRFGLVVLSRAFFAKRWTDYELRGLTVRDVSFGGVILPIWLDVGLEEVLQFSPSLADKKAIIATGQPLQSVATRIIETVRPDIFAAIHLRAAYFSRRSESRVERVQLSKVAKGPIRYPELPPELVRRIRLVRAALLEVENQPFEEWLDDFSRDIYPSDELQVWEVIAASYLELVNIVNLDSVQRLAAFEILLSMSCNDYSSMAEKASVLPIGSLAILTDLFAIGFGENPSGADVT